MKSKNIIGAVLFGVAAGAVLGILLAPDKGTDTRNKIKDAKKDLTDALKAKIDEFANCCAKNKCDNAVAAEPTT